jgi:orotidine-5'-phosphate decarboxylase
MGLMVIVDGKRSDIGPTAKAYAGALLGGDPAADAVTVHPYLGSDGILPFVDAALPAGRGLFVLVKTSNPSSEELQDLYLRGGNHTVYRHVGESVRLLAAGSHGESGYAAVGVVVGATYPEQLRSLRRDLHDLHFLVPGYGAQGAGPADVVHAFDESGDGALINASRSIIFAYRDNGDMQDELYAEAAGVAARNMRDTLNRALEERE